jgi:hypothetical protein
MQKAGVRAVLELRDSNEPMGPIRLPALMLHAETRASRAIVGTKVDRHTAMRECDDSLYVDIQPKFVLTLFRAILHDCSDASVVVMQGRAMYAILLL